MSAFPRSHCASGTGNSTIVAAVQLSLLILGITACHKEGATPPSTRTSPTLAWKASYPGGTGLEVGTIPAVSGDRLFAVTPRGTIAAFDRKSGATVWTSEPGDRISVSKRLLVNGERLLWAGKTVAGLEIATGSRAWTYTPNFDAERCDPTVAGELFVICTDDWTVVALRATSGEVVWTRPLRDSLAGVPMLSGVAAAGDTVFVAVRQDYSLTQSFSVALLFALDRRTGAILSKTQEGNYTDFVGDIATPTVGEKSVVLSHVLKNRLTGIDRTTGHVLWRFDGDPGWAGFLGPLSVLEGAIYAASADRRVYALDATSGQLRWKSGILDGSQEYAVACGPLVLAWSGVNIRVLSRATGEYYGLVAAGPTSSYNYTTRPIVDGTDVFLQSATEIRKMSCPA
jgi:outer membrane protein assembly factor BamB